MYHVYSLPPELLQNLTSRNLLLSSQVEPEVFNEPPSVTATTNVGPRTCNVCLGISFVDVDQQRAHFRSDWHRYNVKARLNGGKPVNEQDFTQLLDGEGPVELFYTRRKLMKRCHSPKALEDSISGSESSDESDGSSDLDTIAALINKQRKTQPESPTASNGPTIPQMPVAWFHSPPDTQIGVYRTLFPLGTPQVSYVAALHDLQKKTPGGRKWAMFMVAGGHFAGAVISVSKPEGEEGEEKNTRSRKPKAQKPDNEVLVHKTFHRYTTRRKQGGSQSANDNAKGPAKSAGALLRRYGEQALRDDIRNLIETWSDEINDCELIFIRASVSNRKIFLDYDGCVISKGDSRLRTIPFPTRRPTQSEITRCLKELTIAKISHLTEDALRAQDDAYLASLPKPKPAPSIVNAPPERPKAPQLPKLTKEEEQLRERWGRLLEMVIKGRLESLKSFWVRDGTHLGDDEGSIDIQIPDWADTTSNEKPRTLLQLASHAGQDAVVAWLLEEMHADPTISVLSPLDAGDDEESFKSKLVAYDLSRNKLTRDAFRRSAAAHPDWWDWFGKGHLPSALHREMEDERDEKKKARRKGLKDRVKERESQEKEKTKELEVVQTEISLPPPATTGPTRLGGNAGDAQGLAGLTPVMRAKIERERRARAAEARLGKLSGS
ncbi:hypothetical protein E1B28_007423 [Marasmius oreades]|uniref:VLRF1 domain-containing protein n=1 Tax=Marasmius oreades TaxID=181124 RepID=A0A9P7S1L8_9AGAR|nr:uncharacterized protein E1B28_007423 [Marasmius oreades]KAG7093776.1 hypothetical protein E1B28_007423 [Marasmius oreades]